MASLSKLTTGEFHPCFSVGIIAMSFPTILVSVYASQIRRCLSRLDFDEPLSSDCNLGFPIQNPTVLSGIVAIALIGIIMTCAFADVPVVRTKLIPLARPNHGDIEGDNRVGVASTVGPLAPDNAIHRGHLKFSSPNRGGMARSAYKDVTYSRFGYAGSAFATGSSPSSKSSV